MQTYLIHSSDEVLIDREVDQIIKKHHISFVNFHTILPEKSIGIEEVRKIEEILSLKPFGGGKRILLVKRVDKATFEAQNAMLKFLEEPPIDTYVILTTTNLNSLLPTVVSRCQIITGNVAVKSDESQMKKGGEILTKIFFASVGERLLLSQNYSQTKEEAITVLEQLLLFLQQNLYLPSANLTSIDSCELIKKILSAKYYLERNVNVKTTLDILFLGFPKCKIK